MLNPDNQQHMYHIVTSSCESKNGLLLGSPWFPDVTHSLYPSSEILELPRQHWQHQLLKLRPVTVIDCHGLSRSNISGWTSRIVEIVDIVEIVECEITKRMMEHHVDLDSILFPCIYHTCSMCLCSLSAWHVNWTKSLSRSSVVLNSIYSSRSIVGKSKAGDQCIPRFFRQTFLVAQSSPSWKALKHVLKPHDIYPVED